MLGQAPARVNQVNGTPPFRDGDPLDARGVSVTIEPSAARDPTDRLVTPEDMAHTVYHAMGVTDLEATDREGKRFSLLPDGEPIRGLFQESPERGR